jgi:hypothetical protein
MRIAINISFLTLSLPFLPGCATRKAEHVEVSPTLLWVVSDSAGRHETTNHYSPCVVSQGIPFTLDFSERGPMAPPAWGWRQAVREGVRAQCKVALSGTNAVFSGRTDYQTHLGVTSNYHEDDRSLRGVTLRSYSTVFRGTLALGREIRIHAGEDINNGPFLCLAFRSSAAPTSKFTPTSASPHY